jgi:hypothetical protein
MHLLPVAKTRVAKGKPRALSRDGPRLLLTVIRGKARIAGIAVAIRGTTAAETRPLILPIEVGTPPAIAAEIPPATRAETCPAIAGETRPAILEIEVETPLAIAIEIPPEIGVGTPRAIAEARATAALPDARSL